MITPALLLSLLVPFQGFVLEPATPGSVPSRIRVHLAQGDLDFAPQQARRAWIGVELATSAEAGRAGLDVSRVVPDSPAARAGLQVGDRLLAVAGKRLESYEALVGRMGELQPGQEVGVVIRRTIPVRLDRRGWGEDDGPRLGVSLSEQDTDRGTTLIVTQLREGWPGAAAGLREGDRIVASGGKELGSFDRLQDLLARVEPGRELALEIEREVGLRLGAFSDQARQQPAPAPDRFAEPPLPSIPPVPPRPETAPRQPQGRWAEPQAPSRAPEELQEQMRSLRAELRALREELSALRRELADLRRGR